jgi:hypothetical protein
VEVIKDMLPTGAYTWEQVSTTYRDRSWEDETRDKDNIKQHWVEKMCNKFKIPTVSAGTARAFTIRWQKVQKDSQEVRIQFDGCNLWR